MVSHSGRYLCVFNGEIYNFREIRLELIGEGIRFRSNSDTEVMLQAFERWGLEGALKRMNGMFAVAVWDAHNRHMYLCRDRLGVKPLYYQWNHGTLAFSSELNHQFSNWVPRSINRGALAKYLRHGYVPTPDSIYDGIFKLPPGILADSSCQSVVDHKFESLRPYWDTAKQIEFTLATNNSHTGDIEECVERLNFALARSVKQHMISDVPLGAFLSGGIDSSLVVAHMQNSGNGTVKTFTIGFEDREQNEATFAKKVADRLGTSHTEFYVGEQEALAVIPDLAGIYGEPFADSSQIPTYLVSKLARGFVTVALSGDGGDELFGGYKLYENAWKRRALGFSPIRSLIFLCSRILGRKSRASQLQRIIGEQRYTKLITGLTQFSVYANEKLCVDVLSSSSLAEKVVKGSEPGTSLLPVGPRTGNIVESLMCRDLLHYLPDDILTKVDRASMAVSLEVRAPFADDFELFNFAWGVPFSYKVNGVSGKIILKRALDRFLPRALFDRPKKGFSIPMTKWLNGALAEWVDDCTSDLSLRAGGYFDANLVRDIRQKVIGGDAFFSSYLWAICIFQSWLPTTAKKSQQMPVLIS